MKGSGTILVIDDEEDVLLVSRSTLERLGYAVLEARTGEEAVRIARSFAKEIDLAILDIGLPDIRGDKLFDLIGDYIFTRSSLGGENISIISAEPSTLVPL